MNIVFTVVPNPPIAATIASATPAAIRLYSTAVAPDLSPYKALQQSSSADPWTVDP